MEPGYVLFCALHDRRAKLFTDMRTDKASSFSNKRTRGPAVPQTANGIIVTSTGPAAGSLAAGKHDEEAKWSLDYSLVEKRTQLVNETEYVPRGMMLGLGSQEAGCGRSGHDTDADAISVASSNGGGKEKPAGARQIKTRHHLPKATTQFLRGWLV